MDATVGDGWLDEMIKRGIVPEQTRRIIIDIATNKVVTIYHESNADDAMFTVAFLDTLAKAKTVSIAEAAIMVP